MRNRGVLTKTHGSRQRLFWFFGGTLLVIVLIIIGFFAFVPLATKEKRIAGAPKTKEEALERIQRDTDNDGLKDWEEKIYGTNPEKADTDKDGTPDGEEIKASRNPLRAGPDDQLSVALPPPEDKNKTQALANEFIGRSLTQVIAESIVGGEQLSDFSDLSENPGLQSYVEKLGQERLLNKVIPPETSEFAVSNDNSPQAVKNYFNAIVQIHLKYFSVIDSDVSILYLAATSNNPKAFRRLDANIRAIEKAIGESRKTPVPPVWLGFAKDYVWYLSKTLAAVKILRNSESDPVSSLLILQDRIQLIDDFRALYADAKTKLDSSGITFSKDDSASLLLSQVSKR